MRKKILIIENDNQMLDILSFALGREGYEVIRTLDGTTGIQIAAEQSPDLVIVDMDPSLPSACLLDNAGICQGLRKNSLTVPILLFVSSAEEERDLLNSGASECLYTPFAMKALLLKVKANTWHLDTAIAQNPDPSARLILGRIIIDFDKMVVMKDGEILDLTQREYDLICFMAQHPGKVFSREDLLQEVWDYTGYLGGVRTVDVSIRRLREKLEDDPAVPVIIITRRGKGYMFAT